MPDSTARDMPPAAAAGLRPAEVRVPVQSLGRFLDATSAAAYGAWRDDIDEAAEALRGRVLWHVNSTARGGGVAEMLGSEVGLARDAGVDARWIVIEGTPEFFAITKRVHNRLHAATGDGGPLGDEERRRYDAVLRGNAGELLAVVRAGDVVVLHDPQTAGLAPSLRRRGATVVWRCHIGHEALADHRVAEAWDFLRPAVEEAEAAVFSRAAYVPPFLRDARVAVIRPAIDPSSPKNQELEPAVVRAILVRTGLIEGPGDGTVCTFRRHDGSPGRVDRGADLLRLGRAPAGGTPLVLQVSRWDRLKDHLGVMRAFASLDAEEAAGAHLLLAGPAVTGVADDPDGPEVLAELTAAWRALPHERRRRIQIASLPMVDPSENGAIVNALQRHATVVVQKSVQEGFGLTVSEAMWKARPVVASAVGGIVDQIDDGRDGVLVRDPHDPAELAGVLARLLGDAGARAGLGDAGRARVRAHGLLIRLLAEEARLLLELL